MRAHRSSRVWRVLIACLLLLTAWAGQGEAAPGRAPRGLTVVVNPSSVPLRLASTLTVRVIDSSGAAVPGVALRVSSARARGDLVTRGVPLALQVTPNGKDPITIFASAPGFAAAQVSVPVVQPRFPAQIAAVRSQVGVEPVGMGAYSNGRLQDSLYFQWRARTTATQRGSLRFADGSMLDMDTNTQVLVRNPARTYLETGQIFLQIVAGGQGHDVETPGGAVAASEGTQYLVRAAGGKTTLTVYSGRLSVRSSAGAVSLGIDQRSTLSAGAPPSAPVAVPPALPAWIKGLPTPPNVGLPTFLFVLRQGGRALTIYVIDRHVTTRDLVLPALARSVTLGSDGQDAYLSTTTGMLDVPLPLGQPRRFAPGVQAAAVVALPQHQLAVATAAGAVAVLDTRTGVVIRSVPLGYVPTGIAASPDGSTAVVAGIGEVSLVDLLRGQVLTTREVPGATGQPAFSADGALGYVPLQGRGSLLELSVAARGPIAQVPIEPVVGGVAGLGQLPAALALADGRVFVADDARNALVAVDPIAGRILATYPLGGPPVALALAPDSRVAAVIGGTGVVVVDPYDGYLIDRVGFDGLVASLALKPRPLGGSMPLGAIGLDAAIGSSVPEVESIQLAPPAATPTATVTPTATPTPAGPAATPATASTLQIALTQDRTLYQVGERARVCLDISKAAHVVIVRSDNGEIPHTVFEGDPTVGSTCFLEDPFLAPGTSIFRATGVPADGSASGVAQILFLIKEVSLQATPVPGTAQPTATPAPLSFTVTAPGQATATPNMSGSGAPTATPIFINVNGVIPSER